MIKTPQNISLKYAVIHIYLVVEVLYSFPQFPECQLDAKSFFSVKNICLRISECSEQNRFMRSIPTPTRRHNYFG